jgi:SM-20-related protein
VTGPTFNLAPDLDIDAAAASMAATGRARVEGVLASADAVALHQSLASDPIAWRRSLDNPANVDVTVELFESQPIEEQRRLVDRVHAQATDDFQYLFDRYRIGAARRAQEPTPAALDAAYDLFNKPAYLDLARRLTGDDRIAYVDAQATRYLPGHFLNAHDDRNDAAGRLYAYVLNLTPDWQAEWGGLLMFMDAPDSVTEVFVPRFNTLNIFQVPQAHAVSMVTPFAGAPRYSITGWWRDRGPG